jgi:hypothetical protein
MSSIISTQEMPDRESNLEKEQLAKVLDSL